MQPINHLPGTEDREDKIRSQKEPTKVTLMKFLKLQLKLKMPRLHSGAATDRPEITNLTLPPIPEFVWQQPQENHVTNVHRTLTEETHKNTHKRESKQRTDAESQTSSMKKTSTQVSVSSTETFLGNQTRSTILQSHADFNKPQSGIQRHEMNIKTNDHGDDILFLAKITNSQIEEQLVRDDISNELYMALSSTIVLKRKK